MSQKGQMPMPTAARNKLKEISFGSPIFLTSGRMAPPCTVAPTTPQ